MQNMWLIYFFIFLEIAYNSSESEYNSSESCRQESTRISRVHHVTGVSKFSFFLLQRRIFVLLYLLLLN